MNKGGKFLKKMWHCIFGGYYKIRANALNISFNQKLFTIGNFALTTQIIELSWIINYIFSAIII